MFRNLFCLHTPPHVFPQSPFGSAWLLPGPPYPPASPVLWWWIDPNANLQPFYMSLLPQWPACRNIAQHHASKMSASKQPASSAPSQSPGFADLSWMEINVAAGPRCSCALSIYVCLCVCVSKSCLFICTKKCGVAPWLTSCWRKLLFSPTWTAWFFLCVGVCACVVMGVWCMGHFTVSKVGILHHCCISPLWMEG